MNIKRFSLAPLFLALPLVTLSAASEQKPIPSELKAWAHESLQEISVESSANALVAQIQKSPTQMTLLADKSQPVPEAEAPSAPAAQPVFFLEFAIEYSGDLVPDVRLTLAKPEPAAAPDAKSGA